MEALPHVLGINFPASIYGSFSDTGLEWVTDSKMQTLPRIKEMRMMELPWQRIEEGFINFVYDNKGCLHQYEPMRNVLVRGSTDFVDNLVTGCPS